MAAAAAKLDGAEGEGRKVKVVDVSGGNGSCISDGDGTKQSTKERSLVKKKKKYRLPLLTPKWENKNCYL